jgi:hypothetical protein
MEKTGDDEKESDFDVDHKDGAPKSTYIDLALE